MIPSQDYIEGYKVGLARRLSGKTPVLQILAEHHVMPVEFIDRVNALGRTGRTFADTVNAVADEIEREVRA
jgi:hypothetical protein